MFKVLLITFAGVVLGYLLRNVSCLRFLSKSITYTIWALLLCFGLQVGSNEQVVNNLHTLGVKAFVISLAGVLGSCVAAWAVLRFLLKGSLPLESEVQTGENIGKNNAGNFYGGFVIVVFFAVGCAIGCLSALPEEIVQGKFSMYVLYFLMVQVGMSIGGDKRLKQMLAGMSPKFLFLPLGTIVGTLVFVGLAVFMMPGVELFDGLAIGAGFGYYSLSSVLITQIKEASQGVALAAQLGTMALMANIMREVMTLLFAPIICKVFGRLAPVSVGGATSMDSTLPVIAAVCGKDLVFVSIFHGVLVDFSVPFLVTFFASL